MKKILWAILFLTCLLSAGHAPGQDKKEEKKKAELPAVFVKIHDDGKAKDSAGLVVEVQGLKVEFLESKTLKLDLKPSTSQKTKTGGMIYSFSGYKLAAPKYSAAVLEVVTFVRGPERGHITVTIPKGKLVE